jgi:hypothetical protein
LQWGRSALGRAGRYFQLQHLHFALDLFGTSLGASFKSKAIWTR